MQVLVSLLLHFMSHRIRTSFWHQISSHLIRFPKSRVPTILAILCNPHIVSRIRTCWGLVFVPPPAVSIPPSVGLPPRSRGFVAADVQVVPSELLNCHHLLRAESHQRQDAQADPERASEALLLWKALASWRVAGELRGVGLRSWIFHLEQTPGFDFNLGWSLIVMNRFLYKGCQPFMVWVRF